MVTGLAPSLAARRMLMFLDFQAFFDESESSSTGEFVLAGYIAPVANWAHFSGEWEQLLRHHGTLADNDAYHFKMSQMAMTDERMARVPIFYRVIRKYVSVAISVRISVFDFESKFYPIHSIWIKNRTHIR
jgi:hypothetical protein